MVRVIEKTGKHRYISDFLAADKNYLNRMGFEIQDLEYQAEQTVEETIQQEVKEVKKRGRKPKKA